MGAGRMAASATMRMLIRHVRWLYLLALLQLLGGPLVVSMVMLLDGPETKTLATKNFDHSVAVMDACSCSILPACEAALGESVPWQKPVQESTTQGKLKQPWSLEGASPIRVCPPGAQLLALEDADVKFWRLGAGPPAPPPREV